MIATLLGAGVLGADRDTINVVTDVLGISAVLAALVLFVLLESRRASGRGASRSLGLGAFAATLLALAIIGGRFQWIPDADSGTPAASEDVASGSEESTTTEGSDSAVEPPGTEDPGTEDPGTDGTVESASDDPSTTTSTSTSTSVENVGPPTPPTAAGSDEDAPVPATGEGDAGADTVGDDPARGPPTTYVVVDGDNFWDIAESMVEAEAGGDVSDAAVATYWQALIDANADGLVEPGNPDLIVPGQVLDVPPVAGSASP